MEGVNMEELTIETSDLEPAGDDVDVLPEATDLDTEAELPENEENSDEEDYESDPDENDVEDAAAFEDAGSSEDENEKSDSASNEETGSSEPYPEKPDRPVSGPETVSGNSAEYPYGSDSDASTHSAYDTGDTGSLLLVETMERQNDILCAGFMSTLFILGIILGVLIIHGFRLRRV